MHSRSRSHNAHLLDFRDEKDTARHLSALGLIDAQVEEQLPRFRFCAIKLKQVESRLVARLKQRLEALGGQLLASQGGTDSEPSRADLLLAATRWALFRLIEELREEGPELAGVSAEIAACLGPGRRRMVWGDRVLDFQERTRVMGILNCTNDSFYPGSRLAGLEQALESARTMIEAGADILDIGGESTRPGSDPVAVSEEIDRVVPVVEAIRRRWPVLISVDTRKKEVAERALDAGADMVNDVSGLRNNQALAELLARRKVPVVLMHMRGEPKTMQENPFYSDTIAEILAELEASVDFALAAGIALDRIIVDPGIGFGKSCQDNLEIIRELGSFRALGFPVLIGLSRKSFIGAVLDKPVDERLTGTVVANTLAVASGADILRVHDVPQAVDTVRMAAAVRRGRC